MKPKLKIFFTDFWPNFELENNFFLNLILQEYDVILTDKNPDYLFYSLFGNKFENYNCIRIQFIGENVRPDFLKSDYVFSFDFVNNNPRHFRMPLYILFGDVYSLTQPKDIGEIMKKKTRFCNFINSNPIPKKRIEFFKKLSKYKKVDSGGRVLNNLGYRIDNKLEFISNYKFTLAFENSSFPGYTTEKIFEPMMANSIPLYWGNELIHLDFNTKSFLNYHDFNSEDEFIERIIQLDNNDELYMEYLKQPYFVDNKVNEYVDYQNIMKQFRYIFSNNIEPVSLKSPVFSNNRIKSELSKAGINLKYFLKGLIKKYIINFSIRKVKYKFDKLLKSTR